ncbi:hypothetical protein PCE1_001025 [Barthelona sp. PCE]
MVPFKIEDLERWFFDRTEYLKSLTPNTETAYFYEILGLQLENEHISDRETELMEKLKELNPDLSKILNNRYHYRMFSTDPDTFLEWFKLNVPITEFAKPSHRDLERDDEEIKYPSEMEPVDMDNLIWDRFVNHQQITDIVACEFSKCFLEKEEEYTFIMLKAMIENLHQLMHNKVAIIKRYLTLSAELEMTVNLPSVYSLTLEELDELMEFDERFVNDESIFNHRFSTVYMPDESSWDIDTIEGYPVPEALEQYKIGLLYAALYARFEKGEELPIERIAELVATGCLSNAGLYREKQSKTQVQKKKKKHKEKSSKKGKSVAVDVFYETQNVSFPRFLPIKSIDHSLVDHWLLRGFMECPDYPVDSEHFGAVALDHIEILKYRATIYTDGAFQKYDRFASMHNRFVNEERFVFLKKLKEISESEESVTIPVMIKNIPELEVRVYHLNSELLAKDGITPSVTMDLSGWIPNSIEKYSYDSPVHIAHDEEFSFDLPKRCYRIVDFVSKDKSWRVLIKKGLLSVHMKPTIDGQELTVYSGIPEKLTAKAYINCDIYSTNDNKVIKMPFFSSTSMQHILIESDGFWQNFSVRTFGESFNVKHSIIGFDETLVPGSYGSIFVYPRVEAHGIPIDPSDVISRDVVVLCHGESVVSRRFNIKEPDRLAELSFKVPSDTKSMDVTITTSYQKERNVAEDTIKQTINLQCTVPESLLGLCPVGDSNDFRLELRSPTGDTIGRTELQLSMHSNLLKKPHEVILTTNSDGQVLLGDVSLFSSVTVAGHGSYSIPQPVQKASSRTLFSIGGHIIVPFSSAGQAFTNVEVFRISQQKTIIDRHEVTISVENKCIELMLEPGMYTLCSNTLVSGRHTRFIFVYDEEARFDNQFIFDRKLEKLIEQSECQGGFITGVTRTEEGLRGGVMYGTPTTRVHFFSFAHHVAAQKFANMFDVLPSRLLETITVNKAGEMAYTDERTLSSVEIYVAQRRQNDFRLGVNLSHTTTLLQPMNVGVASNSAAKEFRGSKFEKKKKKREKKNYLRRMSLDSEDEIFFNDNENDVRLNDKMHLLQKSADYPPQSSFFDDRKPKRRMLGYGQSNSVCSGQSLKNKPLLSYLRRPFHCKLNVEINEDGSFLIPNRYLDDCRNCLVIIEDYSMGFGYASSFAIPEGVDDLPIRPLELLEKDTLDRDSIYVDALLCDTTVDELPFGTLSRVYKSVKDLWILFQDSFGTFSLKEFEWLTEDLSAEEMKEKLHTYWCDEVAFFIMLQRPDLFDTCVRPFLHHKLDRNMLENIMLYLNDPEHLIPMLQKYREPTYWNKLSIFERILLVALTERDMFVYANDIMRIGEKNKCQPGQYAKLFRTALLAVPVDLSSQSVAEEDISQEEYAERRRNFSACENNMLDFSESDGGFSDVSDEDSSIVYDSLCDDDDVFDEEYDERLNEIQDCFDETAASIDMLMDQCETLDNESMSFFKQTKKSSLFSFGGGNRNRGGMYRKTAQRAPKRKAVKRPTVYKPIIATKKYVETSWHDMDNNANHNLFRVSRFWGEFALHMASIPYENRFDPSRWQLKSKNVLSIVESTVNYHEVLFALSLFDVSGDVFCRFYRSFGTDKDVEAKEDLVVRQQIFDPTTKDPNTGMSLPAGKELLINHVYTCEIICFNLSSIAKTVSVMRQVPKGAVAMHMRNTFSYHVEVPPFKAKKISFGFFFPRECDFYMFPATVCKLTNYLGRADVMERSVVRCYSTANSMSWRRISLRGSIEETCSFLREKYVAPIEYSYCYWRANDCAEAFNMLASTFTELGHFDAKFMRLAFKFKNERFMRLYFKHERPSSASVLEVFKCQLFEVNHPEYRFQEFEPYVTQRVFSLGDHWQSKEVRNMYYKTLKLLALSHKPDPILCVYAAYYMLLVERFADAQKYMACVPAEHDTPFTDLIRAYLDVINGDLTVARELVKKHEDVTHLRLKPHFKEIDLLIRELDGEDVSKYQTVETFEKDDHMAHRSRQQEIGLIEETAKYLNLKAGKNCVTIDSDFEVVSLLFYPLEAEILFSNKPFDINDATRKPLISPAVTLETTERRVPIPEEISNNSVIVEARGSGVSKRVIVHPAKFDVELRQKAGILVAKYNGVPLPRIYCKVFLNPDSLFLKDGYTDRRGAFDYFSVSTGDPATIKRLAIFVSSPDYGHLIIETNPPTL